MRLSEDGGEYGLKPHDPEKKRLSEIIEMLNDLFGAEVSSENQLHYAEGIVGRLTQNEAVMAQVKSHSTEQVMHGLLPRQVESSVLDAMTDHEKLSLGVLDSDATLRSFTMVILKMLKSYSENQASATLDRRT